MPDPTSVLPPHARALAVLGVDVAAPARRKPFFELRARVRRELARPDRFMGGRDDAAPLM